MNAMMRSAVKRGLRTACCVSRQLHLTTEGPSSRCSTSSTSSSDFKSSSRQLTLDIMENYGVSNPKILKKVRGMSGVINYNPEAWVSILSVLMKYGFNSTSVVDMVLRHPNLLKVPSNKVEETWNNWSSLFNQQDLVRNLLYQHPNFFSLSKLDIITRCEHLRAVTGSYKYVAQVLTRCPQIMYQSLSEMREVSDYISTKMIVRIASEYYRSIALGCTIEEVKTRHVFLQRCGKYKLPNLKQSESVPTGNPSLSQIFDTSEEVFATKIAGVTLEEFVVFQSMYEEEMRTEKDDSSLESDEDSDED